jgi:undecaprenyl-diphosphatase
MMGIFAIAMLLGMQQKPACRYGVVMSVPTLIVLGIVELCTAVTKIDLLSALLAVLISALASFFFAKVLIKLVKDSQLTPFAVYDGVIGIICIIIGIVEILMKR